MLWEIPHGVHDWKDLLVEAGGWLAGMGVYNTVLEALPEPVPGGSQLYLFFYRLAHGLGANISKLRGGAGPVMRVPLNLPEQAVKAGKE